MSCIRQGGPERRREPHEIENSQAVKHGRDQNPHAIAVVEGSQCVPIESALVVGKTTGWRAADSGTQTIRLIFDEPQRLNHIALAFEETDTRRTQEFVLRWSPDGGRSFREIVRQQWNF